MTNKMRTADATWLDLRQKDRYEKFFDGLLEYFKQHLEKSRIGGSYEYYTCGHDHYSWDRQWELLTNCNPEDLCVIGSTLYVDLGAGAGLYKYVGTTGTRINKMSPQAMCSVETDLYVDFGTGVGLYKNNGTWTRVSKSDPEEMLSVGTTLYVDFGTLGLYKYEGGVMTRIHKYNVEGMGSYANKLVVNFPSVGLYEYNGSTWKRINPNTTEDIIAVDLY